MQHDACGVGFVADTRRRPSRNLVTIGLTALRRVAHRGAPASLGFVDGCGVLTAIPWTLVGGAAASSAARGRTRALGMLFVPDGQALALDRLSATDRLLVRDLLTTHERLTGSRVARSILRADRDLAEFWRIAPATASEAAADPADQKAVNE